MAAIAAVMITYEEKNFCGFHQQTDSQHYETFPLSLKHKKSKIEFLRQGTFSPEGVFLVICDPSMNRL